MTAASASKSQAKPSPANNAAATSTKRRSSIHAYLPPRSNPSVKLLVGALVLLTGLAAHQHQDRIKQLYRNVTHRLINSNSNDAHNDTCACRAPRIIKLPVKRGMWNNAPLHLNQLELQHEPMMFVANPTQDEIHKLKHEHQKEQYTPPPTRDWHAVKHWTLDLLSAKLPQGVEVTVKESPTPAVYFVNHWKFYDRDILLDPKSFRNGTLPKPEMYDEPFVQRNMTIQHLIAELQSPSRQDRYLYFSEHVDLLSAELSSHIGPMTPFLRTFGALMNESECMLWLGQQGVTARTHYDASVNLFTQITGRKRFLLASPKATDRLRLFGKASPFFRQAQEDWLQFVFDKPLHSIEEPECISRDDTCASFESNVCWCSQLDDDPITVWEADLGPGDLLFLPSYTFHRVTSLTPSVSVNYWTHSESTRHLADLKNEVMPFEEHWPLKTLAWAVKLYIHSFVKAWIQYDHQSKHGSQASSEPLVQVNDFVSDLVANRFALLFKHEIDSPIKVANQQNVDKKHTDNVVRHNRQRFATMCEKVRKLEPHLCGVRPEATVDTVLQDGSVLPMTISDYETKVERYALKALSHVKHASVDESVARVGIGHILESVATFAVHVDLQFPYLACCFND